MDNNNEMIAFNIIDNSNKKKSSKLIFITSETNINKFDILFKNKLQINEDNISNNIGFMDYNKNKRELAKLIKDINNIFYMLNPEEEKVKYELKTNVKFSKVNNINYIYHDQLSDNRDSSNLREKQTFINSITTGFIPFSINPLKASLMDMLTDEFFTALELMNTY